MARIDERSSIPLFAAIVAVPFVVAVILWLAAIQYTAVNAESANIRQDIAIRENRDLIDSNQNLIWTKLLEINTRTIRIEAMQKQETK
jgi:hypothetical protein